MSFGVYKTNIELGDTVILYISNNYYAITVSHEIENKKGEMVENVFQTPVGALKVKNLVGVEYGSRVALSKGWGHVLQPTPELWTLTLPHRTQIIYTPDVSMILVGLDLVPGCVVIEAGTGSGSLTHALARRVKPHGQVWSYDFHEQRARIAREEFKDHGISKIVSIEQRDVLQEGFGSMRDHTADAVFLDLPSPWLGVAHAAAAIKYEGGRFCAFSPCIEQVQRTARALEEQGFQHVNVYEVLQTKLKVNRRTVQIREFDFLKHKSSANPVEEKPSSEKSFIVSTWPSFSAGHTGFLTFATLPVRAEPIDVSETESEPEIRDAPSQIREISQDFRNEDPDSLIISIDDSDSDVMIIEETSDSEQPHKEKNDKEQTVQENPESNKIAQERSEKEQSEDSKLDHCLIVMAGSSGLQTDKEKLDTNQTLQEKPDEDSSDSDVMIIDESPGLDQD